MSEPKTQLSESQPVHVTQNLLPELLRKVVGSNYWILSPLLTLLLVHCTEAHIQIQVNCLLNESAGQKGANHNNSSSLTGYA